MPVTIYYDDDADLSLLKDKTIAVIGAHADHSSADELHILFYARAVANHW